MLSYPSIDPVFLRLGPLEFRWYGLMYLVSFVSAYLILRREILKGRLAVKIDDLQDLILYAAIGVIIGGRLGYTLFYGVAEYWNAPLEIFKIWKGGMSYHGGMLGSFAGGWFFCRSRNVSFLNLADASSLTVPVGLGLGRIANFINGELYGRATDVPWCMVFPGGGAVCRHPSQLYEALLEGAVMGAVLWTLRLKTWPKGFLFWSFIGVYGLFRTFAEFFRQPDAQLGLLWGPLSMGQLLSLPMLFLGGSMVIRLLVSRAESTPEAAAKRKR
jgi:phosphatidylglycerol---prolipoprotein diacylglyceryl transferase